MRSITDMARLARAVAIGFPHHITHRGNNRCDVFLCDADRIAYLNFLSVYAAQAQLDIWGYCLMSNHVHLLVVPRLADSLARGVGLAHRRYAVWLNQRAGYSGHLWANRFFSTALDEAHHWMAIRYVERNPVRAGLVVEAAEWPWSSARAHVLRAEGGISGGRISGDEHARYPRNEFQEFQGTGTLDTPLSEPVPEILEHSVRLGKPVLEIDGMGNGGVEALRRCTQTGRPCGSLAFVEMLEQAMGRRLRPLKRGPKVDSALGG
jgi:putative transposase